LSANLQLIRATMTPQNADPVLAAGGGNATAAGIAFQAGVASYFGAALLGEEAVERIPDMGRVVPVSIRVETEAPVDDVLIETMAGGFIFIQAKSSIQFERSLASPFGKTVAQFVRQWIVSAAGSGAHRWDRPLSAATDRLVLAVGPGSSATITRDLALALRARRAHGSAPLPVVQAEALNRFTETLAAAWRHVSGTGAPKSDLAALAALVDVLVFDFSGADRALVTAWMRDIVQTEDDAIASFAVLQECFTQLMSRRLGVDVAGLRNRIARSLRLREPPSYRSDVARFRAYSDNTRRHLEHFEETKVGDNHIRIDRKCTEAVLLGAQAESILLVGDPGAGKSAVISAAAAHLRREGKEVIELAVDRLPVESAEGLQQQVGLSHGVLDVFENWPGNEPAFLFIDALDATRGGRSEGLFRWLIAEVLNMPQKRWRIIASIRSFDLRMGQQFAELFAGRPPDAKYSVQAFGAVRHIHIPTWEKEELEQLLLRAEPIAQAVRAGGDRLFDLARTPFNTRLLADLLSGGLRPDAFISVSTQAQLLDLYWGHRVLKHGIPAEACLRRIVETMVESRSLQADRLSAGASNSDALENLLRESVLMGVSGERYIAFRHHILFDFAASRVYLDLLNAEHLAGVLTTERSLGLMLGPALIFALNELWARSSGRRNEFWRAILICVGRSDIDPVVRSIAARVACEAPSHREDIQGLLAPLRGTSEEAAQAKIALTHVIGSLTVRAEDKVPIALEPWSYFAAELGQLVAQAAWPLRTLLFLLTERKYTADQGRQLGSASRDLLRYALTAAEPLVAPAIGFVGDTYGSDSAASRELLRSLFSPERFEAHGDDDIPWLTRKLDAISAIDPEFVLEIYEKTFARGISDNSETSIGESRILPLRSNRRQDFNMSYWNLKEFFPKFLRAHPSLGTKAYVKAVHGYVLREHPLRKGDGRYRHQVEGTASVLQEDWSHIWASNPDEQHGDNAVLIAQHFSKWLRQVVPDQAFAATRIIVSENEMALVWARLLMVAAERCELFCGLLWPIATSFPFLWASDTRKDCVDFIAASYPAQPLEERAAFEERALAFDFSEATHPAKAREYVLKRLFATIGFDGLRTEGAKAFAIIRDAAQEQDYRNDRIANFEVTSYASEEFWWLREQKVDTEAPENAELLAAARSFKDDVDQQNRTKALPTLAVGVTKLNRFIAEIDAHAGCHPLVKAYATGAAADGLEAVVSMFENELAKDAELIDTLIAAVTRFAGDPSPEVTPDLEQKFEESPSWGSPAPRVAAASAAMVLARTGEAAAHRLRLVIEQLLRDAHPAVRMSIATRINAMWLSDRQFMWQLAERVTREETNGSVLSFFANSALARLVHSDPACVEALTIQLIARPFGKEAGKSLREQIGGLVALLWVSHERQRAKEVILEWLDHIVESDEELDHAVAMLRGGVTLGYPKGPENDIQIRHRSVELADWVSKTTATHLLAYFDNPTTGTSEQAVAVISARLLGHVLNQFYFSSGALKHGESDEEGKALASIEAKREFLKESTPVLERVADVGSPETIHYLIDLLEYLMDANPEAVFDLAARALIGAGHRQGYQFESLGADQVVKLFGRFLADHRGLFDRHARRQTLIKCLDAFIEAGWPSARRLLYRLPELLQ
jgi:hypothetical protein